MDGGGGEGEGGVMRVGEIRLDLRGGGGMGDGGEG